MFGRKYKYYYNCIYYVNYGNRVEVTRSHWFSLDYKITTIEQYLQAKEVCADKIGELWKATMYASMGVLDINLICKVRFK